MVLAVVAIRPAPADESPAVRTVTSPDGLSIVYDERGSGDVALVFVHCWACDRTYFNEQVDVFAADHRVVALDLGGHGESGTEREAWTLESLGGDVVAVVAALQLQRMVLVGHSMGGPVSLMAARQLGERVAGVVVLDTLHDLEAEVPDEAIESFAASFEQEYAPTMEWAVRSRFGDAADGPVADWVVERAVAADPRVAVALMRDFKGFDPVALVTGLPFPIRAVAAAPREEGDPALALETNRRHCDFDGVEIEGVGHFLQLEAPDEVNRRLAEQISDILGTGEPDEEGVQSSAPRSDLPSLPELEPDDVVWTVKVAPDYPARAKRAGRTGEVLLRVLFGTDGAPQQIDVVEGPRVFVPFAIRAVEQWRAEPMFDDQGQPIRFRLKIRLKFKLR